MSQLRVYGISETAAIDLGADRYDMGIAVFDNADPETLEKVKESNITGWQIIEESNWKWLIPAGIAGILLLRKK